MVCCSAVQLPLYITANMCAWGSCVGSKIVFLCRTEQYLLYIRPHSAWACLQCMPQVVCAGAIRWCSLTCILETHLTCTYLPYHCSFSTHTIRNAHERTKVGMREAPDRWVRGEERRNAVYKERLWKLPHTLLQYKVTFLFWLLYLLHVMPGLHSRWDSTRWEREWEGYIRLVCHILDQFLSPFEALGNM